MGGSLSSENVPRLTNSAYYSKLRIGKRALVAHEAGSAPHGLRLRRLVHQPRPDRRQQSKTQQEEADMSYWQDPSENPMTAEQDAALRGAIQEILGVEIDDIQAEQICDVLMFGYPPSIQARQEDDEAQRVVWEHIEIAKMHGCSSLHELFYEVYPRLCEESDLDPTSEATPAFFDSIISYFDAHPEQFEGAFA